MSYKYYVYVDGKVAGEYDSVEKQTKMEEEFVDTLTLNDFGISARAWNAVHAKHPGADVVLAMFGISAAAFKLVREANRSRVKKRTVRKKGKAGDGVGAPQKTEESKDPDEKIKSEEAKT